MASRRSREALIRQWSLVQHLSRTQRGITLEQMRAELGASRATLYRDLALLRDAGVPIENQLVNGESRYRLCSAALPPLGPTLLQIVALRLARHALGGLDGTGAVAELDKLLRAYERPNASREAISFARPRVVAPDLVMKLDRAIAGQRRTRIRYRSAAASGPGWRTVDPLGLRYAAGHLYFVAFDEKRRAVVPFKIDRINAVDVLADKALPHPEFDPSAVFAKSAKIWTGPEVEVVVRLSPAVARLAREYSLVAHQTVQDAPDGAVVVRARVAGVVEAMRWVLSWGKDAEALAPEELRERVAREVSGAAQRYRRARVRGDGRRVLLGGAEEAR